MKALVAGRRPGAAYKPAVRTASILCTFCVIYLYSTFGKSKILLESPQHELGNNAGGLFKSTHLPRGVEGSFLGQKRHLLAYTLNNDEDVTGDGNDGNCTVPSRPHMGYNSSCSFILDQCGDRAQLFNYLKFVLCDFSHIQWLGDVFLALWLVYLISLLATTADNFFVPPLNLLSEKLKLSPSIAGITLLAIGNGAPDVFTAYAGLKQDKVQLVLGALIGASIFISTVVLGSIILIVDVKSGDIDKIDFVRDVSAYMLVVGLIIGVAYDGKVVLAEAISFLLLYFAYIGTAVTISYLRPRGSHIGVKVQFILEWPLSLMRWMSVPPCYYDKKWTKFHFFFAVISPIPMATVLTTAIAGWSGFYEIYAGRIPLFALLVVLGLLLSVLLFLVLSWKKPPHWTFQTMLGMAAFVMSIAWLNIVANEVVSGLDAFGLLFDIDTGILGLTVLAIGNSVGDWVADIAVAKAGKPGMGIASCFGSPLLNDVLGLSIALITRIAVYDQGRPYYIQVQEPSFLKVKMSWIFLVLSLIASIIVFPLFKFSPPKSFGAALIYFYLVFMTFSILNETGHLNIDFLNNM